MTCGCDACTGGAEAEVADDRAITPATYPAVTIVSSNEPAVAVVYSLTAGWQATKHFTRRFCPSRATQPYEAEVIAVWAKPTRAESAAFVVVSGAAWKLAPAAEPEFAIVTASYCAMVDAACTYIHLEPSSPCPIVPTLKSGVVSTWVRLAPASPEVRKAMALLLVDALQARVREGQVPRERDELSNGVLVDGLHSL